MHAAPESDLLPQLAPLDTTSLYIPLRAAVLARLKEAIINDVLKPGMVLRENAIAIQFSVSRTPVREAIRMLEQEKLVTLLPGRKIVVSTPDRQDIAEIYDIRLVLETEALRRITVERSDILGKLRDCVSRSKTAIANRDSEQLRTINTEFHTVLTSSLENKRMRHFLESVYDLIYRFRAYSLEDARWAEQGVREHEELVNLLAAGQQDQAIAMLRNHLNHAKDILMTKFAASGTK